MQAEQTSVWQAMIEWEKSNPQGLEAPALAVRVALAYDQALMNLLHYPEARPRSSCCLMRDCNFSLAVFGLWLDGTTLEAFVCLSHHPAL